MILRPEEAFSPATIIYLFLLLFLAQDELDK